MRPRIARSSSFSLGPSVVVGSAALLVLVASAVPRGQGQAVPVPPVPPAAPARAIQLPPAKGTGLILGQVVDGSTDRPVSGAIVTITGSATPRAQGQAGGSGPAAGPTTGTATTPAGRAAGAGASGIGASSAGGDPNSRDRLQVQYAQGLITAAQALAGGLVGPFPQQRVLSDGDGRFVFHELPKGNFQISATAPGYTNGSYGQRRLNSPSRTIELEDAQRMGNATIRIWKLGSITGAVTDEFGDPVVNVSVRALRRTFINGQRKLQAAGAAQTDDRGVYRFSALQPADYIVAIPVGTTSVPTSLVDAFQEMMTIANGPDRQPDSQRRVEAFMQDLSASNAPQLSTNGYRVGDMQIQPSSTLSRMTPLPVDAGKVFVYQTTFYPGTPTSSQAQVITLSSGDERPGVDLQLRLMPTARVSGTLSTVDGPAANIGLRLVPLEVRDWASESGYETATTVSDGAGHFTFLGVPVGQYSLRAQKMTMPGGRGEAIDVVVRASPVPANGRAAPPIVQQPPQQLWWAEAAVSVSNTDVTNLNVSFRQGLRLLGRAEFDGGLSRPTPDQLQRITVTLSPADGRSLNGAQPARLTADGQFATGQYAPGKYFMNASSPGNGWGLKAIMAGGRDATQVPITLDATDIGGVTVVYSDQRTQISGDVKGTNGAPDPAAAVIIFPANYQAWIDNGMPGRVRMLTTTSKSGTFQSNGLPAGDYLIAAVSSDYLDDLQRDPTFILTVARFATHFTLSEGQKATLAVRTSAVR